MAGHLALDLPHMHAVLDPGIDARWPAKEARVGYTTLSSPIGELLISGDSQGITGVYFEGRWTSALSLAGWRDAGQEPMLARARQELLAYFDGRLTTFSVLLAPRGSAFQLRVWDALRMIPFGQRTSYREIACRIASPKAARAVGSANARNPIPIIVPCHRVIGSDGALTGFGGGLPLKRWLLDHERACVAAVST